MPSRKRSLPSANGDVDEAGRDGGAALLHRIRNMWQFANVCQWIYIFGKVAKIDDSVDVEVCPRRGSDTPLTRLWCANATSLL